MIKLSQKTERMNAQYMCGGWGSLRGPKPGTPIRVRLEISGEHAGRAE